MMPQCDAIGLVVADMTEAVRFYRRLGLDFPDDAGDHAETELAGGVQLMLDTEESIRSFTPDWAPPSGSPRIALAFRFDSPDDVNRTCQELADAGYRVARQPWDAFWRQRYASVLDPDGNGVDLYARLPAD
jgi:catechol 2,3-dioxygenase-like lactoylglutathione lyase family enzyme